MKRLITFTLLLFSLQALSQGEMKVLELQDKSVVLQFDFGYTKDTVYLPSQDSAIRYLCGRYWNMTNELHAMRIINMEQIQYIKLMEERNRLQDLLLSKRDKDIKDLVTGLVSLKNTLKLLGIVE